MKRMRKIYVVILVFFLGLFIIPNTFAADNVIKVSGVKTRDEFQKIIDDAKEGSIIEIDSVYYGDVPDNEAERLANQIVIDKNISIRGQGSGSILAFELIIKKRDGKVPTNVSLSNYSTSSAIKLTDEYAVDIQTPITLNIDKLTIFEIYRRPTTPTKINVAALNIESEASGSTININNSLINSSYDGILFKDVSNITLNVKNSSFGGGQIAIDLRNGSNNKLYFSENCKINARSQFFRNDDAIFISNQKSLLIDIKDTTIQAEDSGEDSAATPDYVFSFDDDNKSTDSIIYLHGNTKIIDKALNAGSAVFNFGKSNTPADNNRFIYMHTVEFINYANKNVYFLFKYNSSSEYAVVGIKDIGGATTVQTYDIGSTISKSDLSYQDTVNKDGRIYKLKNIEYVKANGIVDVVETLNDETITVKENMDIYPNYLKQLNIKIFSSPKTFNALEGDSYSTFKNQEEIKTLLESLSDSKTLNKEFVKFVEQEDESIEINDDYNFTKDITIMPKYDVIVTVDGIEFRIEEGKALKDITDTRLQELKTKDNKTFSRFVKDGETFKENEEIHENITLTVKQNVKVTIDGTIYEIEEGLKKDSLNEEARNKLKSMQEVDDKIFSKFVDAEGTEIDADYQFVKDTTVNPEYNVKVTVYLKDEKKEYTLKEKENLTNLQEAEKSELESFKTKGNHTFSRFVLENGETFEETTTIDKNITIYIKQKVKITIDGSIYEIEEGLKKDSLNEEARNKLKSMQEVDDKIFSKFVDIDGKEINNDYQFVKDTTVTPEYNVKVTVYLKEEKKEYTLKEKQNLTNLQEKEKKDLESFKTKGNHTFSRFVLENDETFEETTSIDKNITIYIKQKVKITIDGSIYEIEEGLKKDSLNEEAKEKLQALEEIKDKEFVKFVDADGKEINNDYQFVKDTVITPEYNVKVTIYLKEEKKEYTLKEKQNLTDLQEAEKSELESFKTKGNHAFSRFVLENGETFKETTSIKENTIIYIKQNFIVTIAEKDYILEEGKKLSSSTEILKALNSLAKVDNKIFEYYYNVDNPSDIITAETIITDDISIKAKYDIIVTIKDKEFTLDEGQSLNELSEDGKRELEELKNVTNKEFVEYLNDKGETVELTTRLNENTKIKARYNVVITIDGIEFRIEEGKTLKDITDTKLQELKTKDNKTFSRFVKDGETFKEDAEIHENITLSIKQNIKVTIKEKDYFLEEGKKLKDSSKIVEALDSLKNVKNKTLKEYYNLDTNEVITKDSVINDNIKIGAKYKIDVIIENKTYSLDEGQSLNELSEDGKRELEELKNVTNKEFVEYLNDKGETVELTTRLNENTKIKARYNVVITIDGIEFRIEEGKTLKDITDTKLQELKTKDNKTFSRFVKDGETFKEDAEIHENITLSIKQNIKVTIKEKDYFLEEGKKLKDSSKIVEALDSLKNVKNKTLKEYYNLDTNEVITKDNVVNTNIKIGARYTIIVTIDDKDYVLNENATLNDLPLEVLQNLKDIMAKEHFVRLVGNDDKTIELDTKLTENTTITFKYDILITIGEEKFVLEEGKTLNDLDVSSKNRLEKLTEPKKGYAFTGYKNLKTGKIITNATPITEDIELELVFEKIVADVPKTIDNIITYVFLGIISIFTTTSGIVFLKRKYNTK